MTANFLLDWSNGGSSHSLSIYVCSVGFIFVKCGGWDNLEFLMSAVSSLSTGTFLIYGIVCAFTVAFVSLWVPETKGRSLEEIQFSFR